MASTLGKVKTWAIRSLLSTLANPSQWLLEAFGVTETASGVVVSEKTALQLTAIWRAVNILAGTEAALPLHLYKKLKPKGKEKAESHPLYRVLHNIANPEMTSYQWREVSALHGLLWGNEYSYIQRTDGLNGPVVGLWPLLPDRVTVQRNPSTNKIEYLYSSDNIGLIKYSFEEILHVPGLGFDGLVGYSPIHMAKEAVGLGLAAERYGNTFFKNGARTSGVLEHPGVLSEGGAAKLRENFTQVYSGLSNAHKVAVLEEGMTYKQLSIPPDEAQFLETRKFQIDEIARLYGLPPHMLGDLDRATYSNIEQQSLEFVIHSMSMRLRRKEQSYYMKLLTPPEQKTYFMEYDVNGLLRGDMLSRARANAIARQWGWKSANDIREEDGDNPIEGGDEYLTPMNMLPAGAQDLLEDDKEGGEKDGKAGTKNPPVNPGNQK